MKIRIYLETNCKSILFVKINNEIHVSDYKNIHRNITSTRPFCAICLFFYVVFISILIYTYKLCKYGYDMEIKTNFYLKALILNIEPTKCDVMVYVWQYHTLDFYFQDHTVQTALDVHFQFNNFKLKPSPPNSKSIIRNQ